MDLSVVIVFYNPSPSLSSVIPPQVRRSSGALFAFVLDFRVVPAQRFVDRVFGRAGELFGHADCGLGVSGKDNWEGVGVGGDVRPLPSRPATLVESLPSVVLSVVFWGAVLSAIVEGWLLWFCGLWGYWYGRRIEVYLTVLGKCGTAPECRHSLYFDFRC